MRLALLLKLLKTFRLSTNMSSSVWIAKEAMAAYQSFIQIMPKHHQGVEVVSALPLTDEEREEVIELGVEALVQQMDSDRKKDLAYFTLWRQSYMGAHPEAWWKVEEAQIVDVVSALPLTDEVREEVIQMVRCLNDAEE